MVKRIDVVMIPGVEGGNVAIPILGVDGGRGNPRNILVLELTNDEKE